MSSIKILDSSRNEAHKNTILCLTGLDCWKLKLKSKFSSKHNAYQVTHNKVSFQSMQGSIIYLAEISESS